MRFNLGTYVIGLLWALVLVVMIFLAAQGVSLQAQFITAGLVIAAILVLKFFRPTGLPRSLVIMLGAFLVLRYIIWRVDNTLPMWPGLELSRDMGEYITGLLLFLAEVYAIFMLFISTFVVIDPMRRERVLLPEDEQYLPVVDVYVPSLNEDEDLLRVTLSACRNLHYPGHKLNVYLLDDGGTVQKRESNDPSVAHAAQLRHESLQILCEQVGVHYLTRERNEMAKAGNLNAAFQRTTGDLIVVFDADHVPSQDFLQKTVGYFLEDPDLFLVQTPHFFTNPDPVERNLGTFRRVPGESEMFYGYIQRGLDKWNASFFCGSAAVLKREALQEVGGFSGKTVTEDAETALQLHANGWKSVYVDEPLIAGLQPESFVEFIKQRRRWSQGMMQIFIRDNPILKPGLSVSQKISYTSSTMFWFFPFARMIFLIAPLFYLFFGWEIYYASAMQFLAYTVPYMIVVIMLSHYIYGKVRYPFFSELYEYVQSLFTFKSLGQAIFSRKSKFNVTDKGQTLEEDHLSPLWVPFAIVVVLLLAGLVASIMRWFYDVDNRDILLVVTVWNLMNLMIALAGFGVVFESAQRRRQPRVDVRIRCAFGVGGVLLDGVITDTSVGGASVHIPASHANAADWSNPDTVLQVPFHEEHRTAVIRVGLRSVRSTASSVVLGIQFEPQDNQAMQDVVKLVYGNSATWSDQLAARSIAPGVLRGIGQFIGLAFRSAGRALRYFFGGGRDGDAQARTGRAGRPAASYGPTGPQRRGTAYNQPVSGSIDYRQN